MIYLLLRLTLNTKFTLIACWTVLFLMFFSAVKSWVYVFIRLWFQIKHFTDPLFIIWIAIAHLKFERNFFIVFWSIWTDVFFNTLYFWRRWLFYFLKRFQKIALLWNNAKYILMLLVQSKTLNWLDSCLLWTHGRPFSVRTCTLFLTFFSELGGAITIKGGYFWLFFCRYNIFLMLRTLFRPRYYWLLRNNFTSVQIKIVLGLCIMLIFVKF